MYPFRGSSSLKYFSPVLAGITVIRQPCKQALKLSVCPKIFHLFVGVLVGAVNLFYIIIIG